MKATVTSMLNFLEGTKQFVIPIYQRTYEWKKEQCELLWDDIVHIGALSETTPHFFGSIVYLEPELSQNIGDVDKYIVIDGQQRLTTLSLLLSALRRSLEARGIDIGISPKEISNYYFNENKRDEQHYKLLLTQSDKATLKNILGSKELPKPFSVNLNDNYQFFLSKLKEIDLEIVYRGIQRLQIVNIVLDDKDKPQLIFEGLNAKGLSLTEADKIRNYVLMGHPHNYQTKLYEEFWYPIEELFRNEDEKQFDRFMRHYLTLKTGRIPAFRDIYKHFKFYFMEEKRLIKLEETLEEIYRYSKYYLDIAVPVEKDHDLRTCLEDLNELKADTAYPFLLEVYDYFKKKKVIDKSEVIKTMQLVESYIFRRSVCGLSLKFLNHTFVNVLKGLLNEREIDYLEYLNDKFLSSHDKKGYYPRDSQFKEDFITKDIYNFSKRDYLLRKLENFGSKEPIKIDNYTIEHIMPQKLNSDWEQELGEDYKKVHELWLHKIGNLTLTGYNTELSNHSFREKRDMHQDGFKFSPLYLNQSLAQVERWNEFTIYARGKELADRAAKIWIYPG